MHLVWNVLAVIGMAVTLLLLGAGAWVCAVVVRNAYAAFLSARASAAITNLQNANVALSGIKLFVAAGKLVACPSAFEDATAHAVHPSNSEIN